MAALRDHLERNPMQKFVERHGRVLIVDIDHTTLRRVRTLTGVRLLDVVDGDLIPQIVGTWMAPNAGFR